MTESEGTAYVEDLHQQAENMQFWKEESEQIDLVRCGLIRFNSFEKPTYQLLPSPLLGEKYTRKVSIYYKQDVYQLWDYHVK